MFRVFRPTVVDAAASHYYDVTVFSDMEVVVYDFLETAFGHDDGNVDFVTVRARGDMDVQPRAVWLGLDADGGGGLAAGGLSVRADVERAVVVAFLARQLFQHILDCIGHFQHFESLPMPCLQQFPTASEDPVRDGSISSLGPCLSTFPFFMTMISSAMFRMRS